MNIETIEINGVELEIEFFYTPEERPSRDCPGELESFEIEAINAGGVDIIDILEESIFAAIITELKRLRGE